MKKYEIPKISLKTFERESILTVSSSEQAVTQMLRENGADSIASFSWSEMN